MADFGDLIVVIPGILGSRLERTDGKLLYDLTLAGLPNTLRTLTGEGLSHLNQGAPPDDDVVATDLFNYQWLPGFFGNDDYGALVTMLRQCVKYPDQQVIKFPYDWRASNRWAAERLNRVARNALKQWRLSSGNAGAMLWLVCHSMGGLVARYFCENLGGAQVTRKLITLGTPHRGSAKALEVLVNGIWLKGIIDVSPFVRSLPSVYELLPQYPVLRVSNDCSDTAFRLTDVCGSNAQLALPQRVLAAKAGKRVPANVKGLLNLDWGMFERAVEFHAAIRNPVVQRMNEGSQTPYSMQCFINRCQPTTLSILLHKGKFEASRTDPSASSGVPADLRNRGDGTVAANAAIPIEWDNSSHAHVVPVKHVAMPASAGVLEMLHNWIRPQDTRANMDAGVQEQDMLGLLVPGMIRQGEVLTIEVDAAKCTNVFVNLEPVDGSKLPVSICAPVSCAEPLVIDLDTPAQGIWRVTVMPAIRRFPVVSDYVLVLA